MIQFTTQEQELFDLLLAVAQKHGTTLRIAGGYIRDAVMGLPSNDLDLAVDNMSGLAFANKVVESLGQGKVGVVGENPERSKHLETAILYINEKEIQLSGFRKETYDNTRIPQVEVGTVMDDCLRRDLTINSLYYNLNTNKLEDLTGLGLKDIQDQTIRTPLPPKQTFLDDPLRVLRACRFAHRFNFTIHPDIYEAVKDQEVLTAFRNKVSRERIAIELRKILTEQDPAGAVKTLSDFGILYTVFQFPEGYLPWDLDQQTPHHELTVFDHTLEALGNLQKIFKQHSVSKEDRFVANLGILFHDLGKLNPRCHGYKVKNGQERRTYYGHEEHSITAAEHILLNLPGTTNKEIKRVKGIIDCARRVNPNYVPGNEKCNLSRKALGKFARLAGSDWLLSLFVSMSDASGKRKGLIDTFDFTYHLDMIEKLKVLGPEARAMRPILNGDEIAEIVGERGPIIGRIIQRLIEFQLSNPGVKKRDAIGYVKSFKQ